MPCAICEHWIPSESQVYTDEENVDGDGRTVYILRTLGGTEKCRVATLHAEAISETLAVPDYFIKVMKNAKGVHILAETLQWRLYDDETCWQPHLIKSVSLDKWYNKWYFICEKCSVKVRRMQMRRRRLKLLDQEMKMTVTASTICEIDSDTDSKRCCGIINGRLFLDVSDSESD